MQATIEQALYEAEVDGLLRSAGRIDIAKRIAKALTGSTSSSWAFRVYEHTLGSLTRLLSSPSCSLRPLRVRASTSPPTGR